MAMHIAIRALYGFNFMDEDGDTTVVPTTLHDFVAICVVAVQYEMEGVLNTVLDAANKTLTLSHMDESEIMVSEFLGDKWNWREMLEDERYTPLMFRVLREHLPRLQYTAVFRKLLDKEPALVRYLFDRGGHNMTIIAISYNTPMYC